MFVTVNVVGVGAFETTVLGAGLLLTALGFVTLTLSLSGGYCYCCADGGRIEGTEGEGVV